MAMTMADAFDNDFVRRILEVCPPPRKTKSTSAATPATKLPVAKARCRMNEQEFTLTDVTVVSNQPKPWVRGRRDGRMTWVPQDCVVEYLSQESFQ